MNIPEKAITKLCEKSTYTKGKNLHSRKVVYGIRSEYSDTNEVHITGYVEGSYENEYYVSLKYDEAEEEIYDYQCECPAYHQYSGMCKHCVALALEFCNKPESKLNIAGLKKGSEVFQKPQLTTSKEISELIFNSSMESKIPYIQPEITGSIELKPILKRTFWQNWTVEFRIGNRKSHYIVKDIFKLIKSIDNREDISYGIKLHFIHDYSAFDDNSKKIIDFLRRYMKAYKADYGKNYVYVPVLRELELKADFLADFLHTLSGQQIAMENSIIDNQYVYVQEGNPAMIISMEKSHSGKGYVIKLPAVECIGVKGAMFIRVLDTIYECDKAFSREMFGICSLCDYYKATEYNISENDMPSFVASLYPVLRKYVTFDVAADVEIDDFQPVAADIKIYLDTIGDRIVCRLIAEYGVESFNILQGVGVKEAYRDVEKETEALYLVSRYFDERTSDFRMALSQVNEEGVYKLLLNGVDDLKSIGEVYISESFKKMKIQDSPKVHVGISLKAGILDLVLDTGNFPMNELEGIIKNYKMKKHYYKLKSGDFISLEDNALSVISEITEDCLVKNKDLVDGHIELPAYRAMLVEQLLAKDMPEDIDIEKDKGYKAYIRDMRDYAESDYEVPSNLSDIMRNYQKTGYRWLRTVASMGFGGILADDMGLGKSIQMIAYITAICEENPQATTLIVCPASLVYNWENEFKKFKSKLDVLVIAGNNADRERDIAECMQHNVTITSYDLLKRDVALYEDKAFTCMVIDEAQNIKNHMTQAAKAVKCVKANVRFALTGTPIENRLSELWSIFDYLMPGMLYSYAKFRKEFETNIIQNHLERDIMRLQKIIKPFILRRIKEDVLKEIPEKTEELVYSKLTGEQEKLYTANLAKIKKEIKITGDEAFARNKLQILAEITRLRQICCEPSLVFEDYKGTSAKMDTCMEIIEGAVAGGHKVLLFSQFTSIFNILEQRLQREHIDYYRLDGQTSKIKRNELVQAYNTDDTPVFLISLKAGGTGLNLTSASIVIHYDPWWNVAAQNQATDRAHRIGQEKKVSVYKLIAKDTIEEKILLLQDMKKELSDEIINQGGSSMAALSKADFEKLL